MDRATADLVIVVTPFAAVAALLFVTVLWRPPFLRRAFERHPRTIDLVFRVVCGALFAATLLRGDGWRSLVFLLPMIVGAALGRRRGV